MSRRTYSILAGACALLCALGVRAQGQFLTTPSYPTGNSPSAGIVGDFNADGYPDLVTTGDDANVNVLLGNGDGTFKPARSYKTAGITFSMTTGDFNNDSRLDVAVTQQANGGEVQILFGNGDGTFQNPVNVPAPHAILLAAGDLNHDGTLDMVVTTGKTRTVVVMLGNGDGTFKQGNTYTFAGPTGVMMLADFNADGNLDVGLLAGPNNGKPFNVILGKGDGTFGPPLLTEASPIIPQAVDVNGDGKPDLIGLYDSGFSVMLGKGDGTFQAPVYYQPNSPYYASSLTCGDFNGDGHPDVMVGSNTDQATLEINNGDGTFRTGLAYVAGDVPIAGAAADLNGDHHLDFISVNLNSNDVGVLLGDGKGGFGGAPLYQTLSGGLSGAAVGDFNGDGVQDFAVVDGCGDYYCDLQNGYLEIFLGQPGGTYTLAESYPANTSPKQVVAADLNGDGKPDLAVANWTPGDVTVFLGNGNGTFKTGRQFRSGSGSDALAAGDFNGDGIVDLAVGNNCTSCSGAGTIGILLGNGDGSFRNPQFYQTTASVFSVAVGDLNRDGVLDVVAANLCTSPTCQSGGYVTVMLGRGDGSFNAPVQYAAGISPLGVAIGDLNGDGYPDLAVANYVSPGTLSVLLGAGDGTFASAVAYSTLSLSDAVAIGDFNGDGKADVAVGAIGQNGTTLPGGVDLLLGNGDGTLQAAEAVPTLTRSVFTLQAKDLSGDGALDLLAVDYEGPVILWNSGGTKIGTTSSPNPSQLGHTVTITTSVAPSIFGVTGVPSGTVTFMEGSTTLGSVTLNGKGVATLKISTLSQGSHLITPNYSGDTKFNPKTGRTITQTVQ